MEMTQLGRKYGVGEKWEGQALTLCTGKNLGKWIRVRAIHTWSLEQSRGCVHACIVHMHAYIHTHKVQAEIG